jgi:hypothetical protein
VFRLRQASRWLQADIGVFGETATELHNEPERHGDIDIIFDRQERLVPSRWDAEAHRDQMCRALHQEIMKWQVYRGWFQKELARGRSVDAFAFYFGASVRPLVAVLGMRYRPSRWDFGLRYLEEDMPADVVRTVEELCFVPAKTALTQRFQEADRLFLATVEALAREGILPLDSDGLDICPALEAFEDI